MPNHIVLASGAVVVVSAAVAAAIIALSESPEVQRQAEDMRRRVALAYSSLSEQFNFNPHNREPRFNRPEDADGFMQSTAGAEPGVDADEESRRRQREELMYWNSVRLNKEKGHGSDEKADVERDSARPQGAKRGSSFDDFMTKDATAQDGTYVYNSGADARATDTGLRHRGEGTRSLGFAAAGAAFANPFADEFHIDHDDVDVDEKAAGAATTTAHDESASDIYSATTRDPEEKMAVPLAESSPTLIDLAESNTTRPAASETAGREELAADEYQTAGQEDRDLAYANIQAWAHNSSTTAAPGFYSPLPVTPSAPMSEPELISELGDGQLTPTDSVSVIGSAEAAAHDGQSSRGDDMGVISESEGIMTPASWSEVGSVISDDAPPMRAQ